MSAIRLAIIGCGAIAATHARVLQGLAGAELVAACDPDAERLRDFRSRFGIPRGYATAEAVAADGDVDAVYVCTQHHIRLDLIDSLMQSGQAVFCEKPLTHDSETLARLVASVEASGGLFWSGYKLRYYSLIERAAMAIASPELIQVQIFDEPWPDALSRPERGGGNVWAQGVYAMELLRLFGGGLPVTVDAVAHGARHGAGWPDRLSASFAFASGAVATVTVGDAGMLPTPVSKFQVCVAGAGRALSLTDRFTRLDLRAADGATSSEVHPEDGFQRQSGAFLAAVRAVRDGRDPGFVPDVRYGAAPSMLIEQACQAAANGRRRHIDPAAWFVD